MTKNSNFRTAESVSPGHPDKICDQISDAILDAYLARDPDARVAVDVAGGHGFVFVSGEVSSHISDIDIRGIVKRIAGNVRIAVHIDRQSAEIARGVDKGGAGDQGIMVGYACSETPEFLPLETVLARKLNQYLYAKWPHDGKTQITLSADEVVSVVASFQHASHDDLLTSVKAWLTTQDTVKVTEKTSYHINPAGDWNVGGFQADAGLTGRKLVIDNYGPRIAIGGGAFSGKDPSKVDRSAAYFARKIALDYLKKRNAKEVYCYLAYAIGYDQPLEATVTIDGQQELVEGYDLSPKAITEQLNLRRPIYEQTARYGHFGHSDFAWEK